MNVSVNGTGTVVITAKVFGTVNLGDLVVMNANGEVKKAPTDADPIGVCASKNGDYISVLIAGGTTLSCVDSTLTVGFSPIKTTASGGIAKATSGKLRLITSIDTALAKAEVIL